MNIDFIVSIIKFFAINMCTCLIFIKFTNIKTIELKKIIILVIFSMLFSFIYAIIKIYSNSILAIAILYILLSNLTRFLTNNKIGYSMLLTIISLAISFITFILAIVIAYIPQNLFVINNKLLNILLIIVIQATLVYVFLKIKRFNRGLYFLHDKTNNDYIDIIMINISAIVILAYCLLGNYYGNLTRHIFICFIVLGIFMIIMIEKSLVLCYKQNLLKKTIEDYETDIKEKDDKIKELSDELFKTSKINHEFHNRINALELKVKEFTSSNSVELGEEIGVVNRIKELEKEYSSKLQEIKGKDKLPLTDIQELDDMFKYMQNECIKNNIDFNLKINGNIYYLINNIIKKNKLETLIGDHIKDAIIAINSGDNKYKSILVILGIKNKCYELSIYDTGVEFKIDTLLKLGLEPTTTHKEDGGSGIGFVTTFETLKECKASLIIQERHLPNETDYTKSVTVRFDGKNEYKILSYRAEDIKSQSKGDRIIIEKY